MKFPSPLIPGTLILRYKRFLADIRLEDGTIVTAHCANSGKLIELCQPGQRVWITQVTDHAVRKLRYDWHLVQDQHSLVGINTTWANILIQEALDNQLIFSQYDTYKREVKYGQNSRIDFLLTHSDLPPFYLEVKNVTHHDNTTALFPDCVTLRGTKHLQELSSMKAAGYRAGILYVVQRTDCRTFKLADHLDPVYAQTAKLAQLQGVEFWAYTCNINVHEITLQQLIPMEI